MYEDIWEELKLQLDQLSKSEEFVLLINGVKRKSFSTMVAAQAAISRIHPDIPINLTSLKLNHLYTFYNDSYEIVKQIQQYKRG